MIKIDSIEDAQEILQLPIQDKSTSREMSHELSHLNWLAVGCMQKEAGEWHYGFKNLSNITMYCNELQVRRWPDGNELDIILST